MVAFHKEFRVSPTITGKSMFRNKIPETLKPGCLCNGMKTPDHDYELHLGSTAKPGIQKLQHSARHLGAVAPDTPIPTDTKIVPGAPIAPENRSRTGQIILGWFYLA
jgi:hypothetical protein